MNDMTAPMSNSINGNGSINTNNSIAPNNIISAHPASGSDAHASVTSSPYVRCPLCDVVLPRDAQVVDDHYRSSMHAHNAQRYQMVMSQRAQQGGPSTSSTGAPNGHSLVSPTSGGMSHAHGHGLGSSLRTSSQGRGVGHPPSNPHANTASHGIYDDNEYDRSLAAGMSRTTISGNSRPNITPPGFHGGASSGAPVGGVSRPMPSPTNNNVNNRVIGAPPGFTTAATSGLPNNAIQGSRSGGGSYGNAPSISPSSSSISAAAPGFGRGSVRSNMPPQQIRASLPPQQTIIHDDDRYNDYDRRDQFDRHEHHHGHHRHGSGIPQHSSHHQHQQQRRHDDDDDDYRRDIIHQISDRSIDRNDGSLFASFPAPTIINDRDRTSGYIPSPSRPIASNPSPSQQSRYAPVAPHQAPSSPGLSFFSFGMTSPPRSTSSGRFDGPDGNETSLGRSPSDSSAAWASSPEVSPAMGPQPSHHRSTSSGHHSNHNNANANNNGPDSSPQLSAAQWPTLSMVSRSPALMNTSTSRGPSSTPGRSASIAGSIPSPLTVPQSMSSSNVPSLSLTGASPAKKVGAKRIVDDDRRDMRPGEDRRVAPPRPKQSRPLHMDVVRRMEGSINKLLSSLMPRPSTFETREWLKDQVQKTVHKLWPDAAVDLFGSSVTRLCEEKGDVDLCVTLPSRIRLKPRVVVLPPPTDKKDDDDGDDNDEDDDEERDKITDEKKEGIVVAVVDDEPLPPGTILTDASEVVEQIGDLLKAGSEYSEVNPLPKARVPIVKFYVPAVGLRCDMGVNNNLALRNSRLIRDYSLIDDRLRQLAYFVKYWARRRKINDPYRGTLSSYCYVLMLINFLQVQKPPVLPCLQSVGRKSLDDPKHAIQGFDTYYYEDIGRLAGFGAANRSSVPELLIGFLRLYAYEFDFHNHIVSVRVGGYLAKKDKKWGASGKRDRHFLSVEDPFEVSHDLGRVCDKEALFHIRGEFMRAHRCLYNDGGDLHSMCMPYTKEWREDRGKAPPSPALGGMTATSASPQSTSSLSTMIASGGMSSMSLSSNGHILSGHIPQSLSLAPPPMPKRAD